MHPIDRFTRDEASAKVWWPFALVLIVLLALTFPGQNRAVQTERDAAAEQAAAWSPAIADGPAAAAAIIEGSAMVSTIRVWSAEGALTSSTDEGDEIGSLAALNDEFLRAATGAGGAPVTEEASTTPTGEPAEPVFRVYTATDAGAIVEVEYDDEILLADTRAWWARLQVVLAVAGLVVLALAIASMREPLAPIGTGVRFYPTSVPPGAVVLEGDEAVELRQAGAYARKRITEQQARVELLEHEKIVLEGELQRALSARSLTSQTPQAIPRPGTPADVAPRQPAGMPAPAPTPAVPVISIPDPEPVAQAAPAPDREAAAEVASAPEPTPVVEPEPVVEPAASVPVPEPAPPAIPAEPVAMPAPAAAEPAKRSKRAKPAAPVAKPAAAAASAKDDSMGFVLVPESPPVQPQARPVARPTAAEVVKVPEADADDDGRHDAQVLDVLERLVEPVGSSTASDPGEMRARLARTAAAKKPGSRSDDRFHE